MTAFWIAAAGLVALAWLMLSGPVRQAVAGPAVALSRRTRVGLAAAVAVFAFGVYGFLGDIDAVQVAPSPEAASVAAGSSDRSPATATATEPSAESVQEMLDGMVVRMQGQAPGTIDVAGWTLVARSYASIQRYDSANRAYDLALALAPDDAVLRAEQAQVQKSLQASQASRAGAPLFADAVTGTIGLSPELAASVRPTDTVFVFAREVGGVGMPLAAARYSAAQFPLRFKLDGTSPMNGGKKLSEVPRLVITARVSRTGEAMPQTGDLRGESVPVEAARDNVQVQISSTQP
ncbi:MULTISPECIES: tetratricopeptide repeat protein [unclassified Variovorax]|uniref:tetratricopeptide repeat protein n=1 Tax=unclassified Variovorax TaxID=663243 RepID=UPI003F45CBA4